MKNKINLNKPKKTSDCLLGMTSEDMKNNSYQIKNWANYFKIPI